MLLLYHYYNYRDMYQYMLSSIHKFTSRHLICTSQFLSNMLMRFLTTYGESCRQNLPDYQLNLLFYFQTLSSQIQIPNTIILVCNPVTDYQIVIFNNKWWKYLIQQVKTSIILLYYLENIINNFIQNIQVLEMQDEHQEHQPQNTRVGQNATNTGSPSKSSKNHQVSIQQIFANAGVTNANLQPLINSLCQGQTYHNVLQQMTEQVTPKMMRLIKQIIVSTQMKQAIAQIRKNKGPSEDLNQQKIRKIFNIPELQNVNISPLIESLVNQRPYNQIIQQIRQDILPRQMRALQNILKSNQLQKVLGEVNPQQSIQTRTEKALKNIFKNAGVERVNLQLVISAMIKGKPYMQLVQQITEETTPKNMRLIRQVIASNQVKQVLKQIKRKHGQIQQPEQISLDLLKLRSENTQPDINTLQMQASYGLQYIKQLEEDLKQIPQELVEHKLRKIQIQYIRYFVQNRQELPLNQQLRQILASLSSIKSIQGQKAKKNIQQGKDIRRNLKILRSFVCGLDMHDILRMIEKGRQLDVSHFDRIRKLDKKIKVILFLGLSKAGKTTILTRLMGYQMQKKKINGIYTVQPKNELKMTQQHRNLVIGYSSRSTTRYPRLYQIPQNFVKRRPNDNDGFYDEDDEDYVTYGMDCPGFEDTAGIEVEIANRITTIEALKKVDKLQIVIVINQKNWGAHGEDITKLAKTVSSIIKNYKQIKDAITFVFNQCDEEFISTLHAQIVDLFENVKMRGSSVLDDNYKEFFKQLKEQTRNPETILAVNPLTLDPYWFMKMVSFKRDFIENASNCLIGDIGVKPKQQISKYCERCINQFKQYFSVGNLNGANYYMQMLQRVGSQYKFQSSAQFQVINMKNSLRQRLQTKIGKLNIQFQQLQIVIIKDKSIRAQKLDVLYKSYEAILKQIQQYYLVSSQSQISLQQQLYKVIAQTSKFYINRMNEWKNCNADSLPQLMDYTKMATDIFQRFGDHKIKQQFDATTQKLLQYFTKQMMEDFHSLNQKNQVNRYYKLFSSLKQCLSKNNKIKVKLSLEQQILKKYKQLKQAVTLIDLQSISLRQSGSNSSKREKVSQLNINNNEEQIKNLQNLLKFMKIIRKYPSQVTKKCRQQIKKIYEYIVIKIPKQIMMQFQQSIRLSFEEQQQISLSLTDSVNYSSFQKMRQGGQGGDKIKNIQKIIKQLQLLNRISAIKQYHGSKLVQCFSGLQNLIQSQMIKLELIKRGFNDNDVSKFKRDIKKMKAQFKQLEKLSLATQKQQIINRFNILQEEFTESIVNFIKGNDVSQNLMLSDLAQLERVLLKYRKLKQFKTIYKILSQSLQKQLRQEVEYIIQKLGKSIIQPLQIHLNEIKVKKRFQASKLAAYIQYVNVLHREDNNVAIQAEHKIQITKIEKQTRQQINNLYNELIQFPLNTLKTTLQSNISLEDNQIDQILSTLKTSFVDKCRKSLRLACQIKQKEIVKNILFSDIEVTIKQFNQTLQTLQLIIKEKIQFKQVSINVLDKLRRIVINLKSVEVLSNGSKQKVFDELNTIIRQKIKSYQLLYQKSREQLFRQGNDPQMFQQQRFINAYRKSIQDTTQVGKKNKQQLQQFFNEYKRKLQKKLGEANLYMQTAQDSQADAKALQYMKSVNKYFINIHTIKSKIPEFHDDGKIKDVQNLISVIDSKVMQNFNNLRKQVPYMRSNQLQKKFAIFKQIQSQIKTLKDNGHQLPEIQTFKKQNGVNYLIEQLSKQMHNRQQMIQQLKNNTSNNLDKIDGNFNKIYQSLQKSQRDQILQSLKKQSQVKIIQLTKLYDQDYAKFQVQKKQFEKTISVLPTQLLRIIKQKMQNNISKFQQQYDDQIKRIGDDDVFDLQQIANLAKKFKFSGNVQKIKILQNSLKQITNRLMVDTPSDDYIQLINKQFWLGEQIYEDVPQTFVNSISRAQFKILQRIQKVLIEKWQKIYGKYNLTRSGFDQSMSEFGKSQFPKSQTSIFKKIGNVQDKITYIIQSYCTLSKALTETKVLSNQSVQKIQHILGLIEQNFIDFLNMGRQCVERFECIAKDASAYDYNIQQNFFAIRLYQKDFQVINMSRKSQLEAKLKNQMSEFSQLFARIRHSKQQLYARVNSIMGKKFQFFSQQTKNNSEQQEQKRVQAYENNLKTLQALCSPYNTYMMPPKQITIQKTKSWIQIQSKKAVQQFDKAFRQFINNQSQDSVINHKITSIPKLFKKISSKPRHFFIYCSQYEDYFSRIYKQSLKNQDAQLDSLISQIVTVQQNKVKQFEQFKKSQLQKLEKYFESNRNEKMQSIKQAERMLKSKIEIETDQKQKLKLQIQLDSKLKQIQATSSKNKNHEQTKYQQRLQKYVENNKKVNQDRISTLIKKLLKLKKLSAIQQISVQVNNKIDDKLKKFLKFNKILQQLHDILMASDSYGASLILDEHSIFKKFKGIKFAQQTKQTNSATIILGEMLKRRSINNDQKQAFENFYNKLDKQQSRYIKSFTQTRDKSIINSLVLSIKSDGQQFQRLHELGAGQIKQDKRISLLAKIFALWSIGSSEDQGGLQSEVAICNKAHAAQILCILIILNLDYAMASEVIKCNRLAEVKTGEGKSIVLAVLSIYFALFGYEVHCACYSNMLSKRDEKQFEKMFEWCGVKEKIHYGIFEDIIKRVLNQKDQKMRKQQTFQSVIKNLLLDNQKEMIKKHNNFIEKFKSFFGGYDNTSNIVPPNTNYIGSPSRNNKLQNLNTANSNKKKSKKVLIIDEIDVLFNKNYYGDTFNQSIDLKDDSIVKLFWFIWKNKENITPEIIENSDEFNVVIQRFKPLQQILRNQLHGMVAALQTYKEQNYLVIDKKIMYKVEDSIMDVSYSYNTIYAYLEEFEKNKISETAFNDHMTISLCVAEFSYACLPQYYANVVGVTGTLTCLPVYIKAHLQSKYKIDEKQMFPIPSVYGSKTENRKIMDSIICDREDHFAEIVANLDQEFSKHRPILVFFRNKSELLEFYNSEVFHKYQKFTSYITEEHNEFERNERIKISSYKETITLLTNSFIRGTDFKLLNKKALEHGGFHAIVTYLIDTTADYIQATGRVARQGKQGSFIEIYVNQDLQLLGINADCPQPFKKIPIQRSKKQEKQKDSCEQKLAVSQKRHDQTIKIFLDNMFDQDKLINYVFSKNKFPVIDRSSNKARIIMIVDATGSMNVFFTQLKLFLPQIFDDVYETLQTKDVKGSLQMQIVLYRNYNSPINQLIQFSTFENQAQNLKKFIKQSKTAGGWGNQAVQVALQHANAQKDVNQIILIGDDRGNTIPQVKQKRGTYPQFQQQRLAHGYTQTSTERQTEELIRKGIKVSGFYLKGTNDIKIYFEKLAKQTKGTTRYIDIYAKNSSAVMTQFIVQRALKAIGGEGGQGLNGDALVAEYKLILSKRMGR